MGLEQDNDVLDTWFSSWLWPFSTLGWPKNTKDLAYFYPTDTLVTAPEIIFFWVARMIMAGLFCMKEIPFRHVYIHGTVRDLTGKKMSKSLGNIIDPLEIIDQVGADALRYTLVTSTAVGTDVFISEEKFTVGRNFANKLWNTARFLNSIDPQHDAIKRPLPKPSELLSQDDQWILNRLQHTIVDATKALDRFQFNEAASRIYEFIWHDVCDWYLELTKVFSLGVASVRDEPVSAPTSEADVQFRRQAETSTTVLAHALSTSLRLLHPFMPFITEELWMRLRPPDASLSIVRASWPRVDKRYLNPDAEQQVKRFQDIVRAVRDIRHEFLIEPGKKVRVVVKARSQQEVEPMRQGLKRFARLGEIELGEVGIEIKKPANAILIPIDGLEPYVDIGEAVDIPKARERLQTQEAFFRQQLHDATGRLANREFTTKAPREVIEREKAKQAQLQETVERFKDHLAALA